MIRKANLNDIELIEDAYNEHFEYEIEHGAFTVFKKGVYPTRKDAEDAVHNNALYVYEENNNIAGSIIIDKVQPIEYEKIRWGQNLKNDEVMVIHLLMVRPSMSGRGVASSLIKYASGLGKDNLCKALRLDTGSQNIPAISLYRKSGFEIVATSTMKVGNVIEHNKHLFLEKKL